MRQTGFEVTCCSIIKFDISKFSVMVAETVTETYWLDDRCHRTFLSPSLMALLIFFLQRIKKGKRGGQKKNRFEVQVGDAC